MGTDVIIKANGHGIIVVLPNDCDFNKMIFLVRQKFLSSRYYFREKGEIYISFSGRNITSVEKEVLIQEINGIPGIDVHFIMDDSKGKQKSLMLPVLHQDIITAGSGRKNSNKSSPVKEPGLFYHGTLCKGDILEVNESIIILGDVEPGAHVISSGNIIITGKLRGAASAGRNKCDNRFVLASYMMPTQINIGRTRLKLTRKDRKKLNTKEAVMAYILECNIVFEPLPFENYSNDKLTGYLV